LGAEYSWSVPPWATESDHRKEAEVAFVPEAALIPSIPFQLLSLYLLFGCRHRSSASQGNAEKPQEIIPEMDTP